EFQAYCIGRPVTAERYEDGPRRRAELPLTAEFQAYCIGRPVTAERYEDGPRRRAELPLTAEFQAYCIGRPVTAERYEDGPRRRAELPLTAEFQAYCIGRPVTDSLQRLESDILSIVGSQADDLRTARMVEDSGYEEETTSADLVSACGNHR
ncbi:hypothetical protein BGZ94_006277, partial [Podila epigama]